MHIQYTYNRASTTRSNVLNKSNEHFLNTVDDCNLTVESNYLKRTSNSLCALLTFLLRKQLPLKYKDRYKYLKPTHMDMEMFH